MTAGWPQWTVPDDAVDAAVPVYINADMAGSDVSDSRAILTAAAPYIVAAVLRQAARHLDPPLCSEDANILERWADEVQP